MKCQHWPTRDTRCQADAKYLLFGPDGKPVPGGQYCEAHTTAPIQEYRDKLGQEWYAESIDEHGVPVPLTPIITANYLRHFRTQDVPESVQHSDFGCNNCLQAGVECKRGAKYSPRQSITGEPSCGAYVYYD